MDFKQKYYKYDNKICNILNGGVKNLNRRLAKELQEIQNIMTINDNDNIYQYNDIIFQIPDVWPFKMPVILSNHYSSFTQENWTPFITIKKFLESILPITEEYLRQKREEQQKREEEQKREEQKKQEYQERQDILFWDRFFKQHLVFDRSKKFAKNNKCKIIISFDSNPIHIRLIEKFIEYDLLKRQKIVDFLFDNQPNIEYYICSNKTNVFFYDKLKLENLIRCLNKYKIKNTVWTKEKLLELPCFWISQEERDKDEYDLIYILFGTTSNCGWISEDNDYPVDFDLMNEDIKNAYLEYLFTD
jgi:hypothetical protein